MTDAPLLSSVEQRILGSLLEKERTVPASYPLTLNALRTACNQASSRDPVVDYDERLVEETTRELKRRGLVRIVWADSGRRTLKYHETLVEALELADDERAVVTVLLLRGAQTAGELRARTERLHAFEDKRDVEATLSRLATREFPVVVELPKRPGERDNRWQHLLGEAATVAAPEPQSRVELDLSTRDARVRSAYDALAATYAEQLCDELTGLPFERWMLKRVADLAGPFPVVEVGCGPGHVTAYLADLGVAATGVDLSAEMVARAQDRYPQARYRLGDLRSLLRPVDADGWGAVVAWYSLIHFAPAELPEVVAGLVRPLRPGGWLVFAGHAGSGVRHLAEWFDQPVDLDIVLHEPATVTALFEAAGLTEVTWYRRGPIATRGETTERCYVLGRRPTNGAQTP